MKQTLGRSPKHDPKQLEHLTRSFFENECGGKPSEFRFKRLSEYLEKNGIDADENYLRHNATIKKVKESFSERVKDTAPPEDVSKLQKENQELRDFILGHFIDGVCARLVSKENPYLDISSTVTEEAAAEATATPDQNPFENETTKTLSEFYERSKKESGKKN